MGLGSVIKASLGVACLYFATSCINPANGGRHVIESTLKIPVYAADFHFEITYDVELISTIANQRRKLLFDKYGPSESDVVDILDQYDYNNNRILENREFNALLEGECLDYKDPIGFCMSNKEGQFEHELIFSDD